MTLASGLSQYRVPICAGTDAAEKVFERDAKRLGKLGNKAKSKAKAVAKGRR